jgi:UDPglucose 6-dehydrogenase
VQEVARGIGLDNRIGSKFLHAGPGYGGSCFPKDTLALMRTGQDYGVPLRLVEAVVGVNDARKTAMARKIVTAFDGNIQGKTIALLGLTFKPNTDDMRESPSIPIVYALLDKGARIRAYDPEGMEEAKKVLGEIEYRASAYDCIAGADAAVIVTEWDEFRALDLDRVKTLLARPLIIDLRNIYRPDEMARRGFHYESVGRKGVAAPPA